MVIAEFNKQNEPLYDEEINENSLHQSSFHSNRSSNKDHSPEPVYFSKKNRKLFFILTNKYLRKILVCFKTSASLQKKKKSTWKQESKQRRWCRRTFVSIVIFYFIVLILDYAFHSYGIDFADHNLESEIFHNKMSNVEQSDSERNTYVTNLRIQATQEINQAETSSSFSVVMNTYKHPDRLRRTVKHYAETCGKKYGINTVYIIWAEVGVPPPSVSSFFDSIKITSKNQSPVKIIQTKETSLNTRFTPVDVEEGGGAIFMADDDIQVSCVSLSQGFEAWKTSPLSLTGFYPRMVEKVINGDEYVYRTWPTVFFKNTFNIILPTKAAFLHSKYLSAYSDESHPKEIKDIVDNKRNCEDIAMAFLIANLTKPLPEKFSHPIYVEGNVRDFGLFSGISTASPTDHFSTRSVCINELIRIYDEHNWGYPLSDVKLTDRLWLRHYPGYWWQTKPSNFFEWFAADILNIFHDYISFRK